MEKKESEVLRTLRENGTDFGGYIAEIGRDGHGTAYLLDDVYVGQFNKDNEFHGHGTLRFGSGEHSGDVYVGEFKVGQYHGQGTYTMAGGDEIVGEFKDNKAHGHGTYTFTDGQRYVGELKNNKEDGYGTWTHPDGDSYVGDHKDGKVHGSGTWTSQHGAKFVGEYRNSEQWEGTAFDKDGKVTATYSDGERKLSLPQRLFLWSCYGCIGILASILIFNLLAWLSWLVGDNTWLVPFSSLVAVCSLFYLILFFMRKRRSRWDQLDQLRSKPMEGQNSPLPTMSLSASTPETDDGRIPW